MALLGLNLLLSTVIVNNFFFSHFEGLFVTSAGKVFYFYIKRFIFFQLKLQTATLNVFYFYFLDEEILLVIIFASKPMMFACLWWCCPFFYLFNINFVASDFKCTLWIPEPDCNLLGFIIWGYWSLSFFLPFLIWAVLMSYESYCRTRMHIINSSFHSTRLKFRTT